jgi:hypothetical protein
MRRTARYKNSLAFAAYVLRSIAIDQSNALDNYPMLRLMPILA